MNFVLEKELHVLFGLVLQPGAHGGGKRGHVDYDPRDTQSGVLVETTMRELRRMPAQARVELIREMFITLGREQRAETLSVLADDVNRPLTK